MFLLNSVPTCSGLSSWPSSGSTYVFLMCAAYMSTCLAKVLTYVVGSKSFRPDIQKPRQMENAVRDI